VIVYLGRNKWKNAKNVAHLTLDKLSNALQAKRTKRYLKRPKGVMMRPWQRKNDHPAPDWTHKKCSW
jgi:hypothetical protein